MSRKLRLLLGAAIAVIAMTAATGLTQAAEFEISPGGAITSTSLGLLTFHSEIVDTTCEIVLVGELEAGPIEKVRLNIFGYIKSATVTRCNGINASITLLRSERSETWWPLTYQEILGTLPSEVEGVLFNVGNSSNVAGTGAKFLLEITTIFGTSRCLYEGDVGSLLEVEGENPYTTGLITTLGNAIPLRTRLAGICPSNGSLIGSFRLSPQQTLTRI